MLEKSYAQLLEELIHSLDWGIDLAEGRKAFLAEKGPVASSELLGRRAARMKARANGVLFYEKNLPAFPRSPEPIAIYTKDFSKSGVGFVAARQFLPEEVVRLILPTFWAQIRIARCTKRNDRCYNSGGVLISWHPPEVDAFSVPAMTCETVSA